MLLSLSLENWMSFRDPVTLSMIASKERQHRERVPKLKKYRTSMLPVAAIYGGNASGKSNFFKALGFAKKLVVFGFRPDSLIPVQPFRLDDDCAKQPARFRFELLVDETVYEFSFAVTQEAVLEEKLVHITAAGEKTLYDRREGGIVFDQSLNKEKAHHFVFQGTRDNQLFLTNSVSQKVETFQPVYNWFKNTLTLIAPDAKFNSFERFFDEGDPLYEKMNIALSQLDTGIAHLGGEIIPFESIRLPDEVVRKISEESPKNLPLSLHNGSFGDRFLITREKDDLIAKKLVTYHRKANGEDVRFNLRHESDGSQRIIDLIPAFLELTDEAMSRVYVIDELDRSLHTLLTRKLLETYLSSCGESTRAQLLLTTHDVLLMDQDLLRRDEMWVAERDASGSSTLFSFSEYKDVRSDKNIRKSYLQGRLGGIPRLLLGGGFDQCPPRSKKSEE